LRLVYTVVCRCDRDHRDLHSSPTRRSSDLLVLRAERVLEPAQLRQSHVQRHLPTLERLGHLVAGLRALGAAAGRLAALARLTTRSEEHTSELQSRENLVCRLPPEKKNAESR